MCEQIFDIALHSLQGNPTSLGAYRGQVMLIVNVASQCGLTSQYTGLERLSGGYRARGLVVLGFPCNDFGGQEPGSSDEIEQFCQRNYGVSFPMFEKISVNREARHPLYRALIRAQPAARHSRNGELAAKLAQHGLAPVHNDDVMWNFEKFLVGRDGTVLARFAPDIAPDDPALVTAIEAALG